MEPISLHKIGTSVLLLVLCTFTTSVCTDDSFLCHKEDGLCGCAYQLKNGSYFSISLSGLNKESDGPYFPDIIGGTTNFNYELNLCTGFTSHKYPECKNVAGCQVPKKPPATAFPIAKPEIESFSNYESGKPLTVTYARIENRTSILEIHCDPSDVKGTATFSGEKPTQTYNFMIKAKSVCPQRYRPHSKGRSSGGRLSTGSILLIAFFCVLVIYLVAGALFMKYKRGAAGKELVPNVEFWSSLPGLVKDGCVFFGAKMKQLCGRACNREGYNEI